MDDDRSLFTIRIGVPQLVWLFAFAVLLWSLWQLAGGVGALTMLVALQERPEFRTFIEQMQATHPAPGGLLGQLVAWARAHILPMLVAHIAFSAVTLVAAIGLMRRRPWARGYFVALLALIALVAAAGLAWVVAEHTDAAGAAWDARVVAGLRAYATLLGDPLGLVPTVVLLAALLAIGLLQSPLALLDEREAASLSPLDPRRAPVGRAFGCAVLGIVVPLLGFAGLAYASVAWMRLQNAADSRGRARVVVALLLGALSVARDVALARLLLERVS